MPTPNQAQTRTTHWGYHASDSTLRKDGVRICRMMNTEKDAAINFTTSLEVMEMLNSHASDRAENKALRKALDKAMPLLVLLDEHHKNPLALPVWEQARAALSLGGGK